VHGPVDDPIADGPGEGVGLGQEEQDGSIRVMGQIGDEGVQVPGQLAIMLMGHLHALGGRCGAGGVDDGAEVGLADGVDPLVKLGVADRLPIGLQLLQGPGFQAGDPLQGGAFLVGPLGLGPHLSGLYHQQLGVGVVDDESDLLG